MPTDAQVLYRDKPPAGITGPPAAETSPPQTQPRGGGSTSQSSSSGSPSNGQTSSNESSVIAGSVVGSVAAICLVMLAFYLGRRRGLTRKETAPEPERANDGDGGKAELHATPVSSQMRETSSGIAGERPIEQRWPEFAELPQTENVLANPHGASELPSHPRTYELPS